MTTEVTSIRPLDPAEAPRCAGVLARAFHDDPLFAYGIPDAAERERVLPGYFAAVLRGGLRYGAAHTTEGLDGAAVWLAPGNAPLTLARLVEVGLLQALMGFGRAAFERTRAATSRFDDARRQAVPVPHWHLLVLGVDPEARGRGLGGGLLAPVLSRADAAGLFCSLETVNGDNVRFYERHGFRVAARGVAADGPEFWSMVREPAAGHRRSDPAREADDERS